MTNQRSEISTIDVVKSLRSLSWPVWLFTAAWILLAIYWQCLAHRNGIFGEMWDTLPAYRALGDMGFADIAHELLRKYALVHIIALPKLGFWIDFHFFGASGQFTRASSFIVLLLCFLLTVFIAIKHYQRPAICVVLGALLFFNGFQAYVINWESLLQYYLAVFFALLAFIEYDRKPEKLLLPSLLLLLSGLSCGASIAAIAGFSFMVLVQYWHGIRPSHKALVAYAGFLLLMAWLLYPDSANNVVQNNIPDQQAKPFFWHAPGLLLQYLAFPFSAWGEFRWMGLFVLLSAAHSAWVCLINRKGVLSDYVLIYFFLIACTIALGRYKAMGMDGDVSRYYVYIAPLWLFSLLKLLNFPIGFFYTVTTGFCASLLVGSLSSMVVLVNIANKMEMARVVALNGNFRHFASQRLDATGGLEANLQNSRDYLHANNMDIYYRSETVVKQSDAVCHVQLVRKSFTTKGSFVDYVLQTESQLSGIYLADGAGKIMYYGTAYAAATHLDGWAVALRDVKLSDWPLLLPLSWLKPEQRLLYIHLPRFLPLDSLPAWGQDYRGNWCRLTINAAL